MLEVLKWGCAAFDCEARCVLHLVMAVTCPPSVHLARNLPFLTAPPRALPLPLPQMLSSGLLSEAQVFASDQRLPANEGLSFRLDLIRVLREQGQALAQVGGVEAGHGGVRLPGGVAWCGVVWCGVGWGGRQPGTTPPNRA